MSDKKAEVPVVGQELTRAQINTLVTYGQCVACGARDEYDFDLGNGYWSCMACQAEFEVEEGTRGRIKSAVRRELTSATMDKITREWEGSSDV